jgi:glyoxylase-like metal-dependent hydrolase (beta-lactamase superfamily II)
LEVTPGIHKVDRLNANVLVFDQKELTLIDAGMPTSAQRILDHVDKINRKLSEITRIVVTHSIGVVFEEEALDIIHS